MQNVETGKISRAAQRIETKEVVGTCFRPRQFIRFTSGSVAVISETRAGELGRERMNNEAGGVAACEVGAG